MKTTQRPAGTNQLRSDFDRLHTALTEAVVACRVKAGKQQVHSLRTGTRKLEALLRKALEDHRHAAQLHQNTRKAQRELKRLRQAAGPVRDLDVHRELAGELQDQAARSLKILRDAALAREFKKLDRSLRRRRKHAAHKLENLLERRQVRLERTLEETAEALVPLTAASPPPLKTAAKWTRSISMLDLDPAASTFQDDLHSYRKQTKAARYIASLQESSADARRLAERLKQTQDSIGRWHDLMLLSGEAAKLLGKHSALTAVLRSQRDSALHTATGSLQDARAHFAIASPRHPSHRR